MSGEDGPTKAGYVSSFRSRMVVLSSPSLTFYFPMVSPGLILWHPPLPIWNKDTKKSCDIVLMNSARSDAIRSLRLVQGCERPFFDYGHDLNY